MAGPDSDVFSDPEIDDYFLELDDAELATNSRYTAAVADDDANTCIDTPEASDDVFPSSKAYPGCSGDSAVVKYPFNDGVGTVGGDWLPARSGEGEDSSATNPMTNRGEETIQPTAGNTQKEGKAAQNTEDILVDGAGLQSSRALADDSSPPTTQKPSPDDSQPAAASLARLSGMKPFVRGPIPKAVQPRSIIVGLDTRTLVRTCFRLGEAIRFGSARQGMPDNSERGDILVELYARVSFSERVGNHQTFQFLDLFHDRPPFFSGTFESWRRCELWDADSAAFLGPGGKGRIARAMGRMKRRERRAGEAPFHMQILLVRVATWADVEFAKQLLCGEGP